MAGLAFFWGQGTYVPPVAGTGGQAGLIYFWFTPGTVTPPEPEPSAGNGYYWRRRRRRR